MLITRFGAERIVRYAFSTRSPTAAGRSRSRTRPILKYAGVVPEEGTGSRRSIAASRVRGRIIDATAMHGVEPVPVRRAGDREHVRDILSDEMAGLVGGLGMAPGANIAGRRHHEAARLRARPGRKGIANPTAMIGRVHTARAPGADDVAGRARRVKQTQPGQRSR
jgi:isocitrate dehydrogenase (NAD+)